MKTRYIVLIAIAAILSIGITICGGVVGGWFDTWFGNKVEFVDNKIDDATNYEKIKKVEDACRSMIASYESDRLIYIQYKDSDNEEKQSWGEQAKMRANKTAATYNEYIMKNSFLWKGNVPVDIRKQLEYLS